MKHMHKHVIKRYLNNSTLSTPMTAYTILKDSIDPDQKLCSKEICR